MTAIPTPMTLVRRPRNGAAAPRRRQPGRTLHAAAAAALALVLTACASPAMTQATTSAPTPATTSAPTAAPAPDSPPGSPPPLQTVASVDLSRYVGTWHEIARYPFGIQDRNCGRDTTADYTLLASGQISVVNRCLRADGTAFVADGIAWVMDPQTRARLQVSFLPAFLRALPIGRGDYWIIELAPDYSWVVIGEPKRRYLWVLARSPNLPQETLAGILGRLPTHGYDPARVIASPGRPALR